ncbi:MAG: hypothetical protein M1831_002853 [Alyxoria varia]|nr:MAG: hypothetical protein M1831_002853 [Alyxoria varia]
MLCHIHAARGLVLLLLMKSSCATVLSYHTDPFSAELPTHIEGTGRIRTSLRSRPSSHEFRDSAGSTPKEISQNQIISLPGTPSTPKTPRPGTDSRRPFDEFFDTPSTPALSNSKQVDEDEPEIVPAHQPQPVIRPPAPTPSQLRFESRFGTIARGRPGEVESMWIEQFFREVEPDCYKEEEDTPQHPRVLAETFEADYRYLSDENPYFFEIIVRVFVRAGTIVADVRGALTEKLLQPNDYSTSDLGPDHDSINVPWKGEAYYELKRRRVSILGEKEEEHEDEFFVTIIAIPKSRDLPSDPVQETLPPLQGPETLAEAENRAAAEAKKKEEEEEQRRREAFEKYADLNDQLYKGMKSKVNENPKQWKNLLKAEESPKPRYKCLQKWWQNLCRRKTCDVPPDYRRSRLRASRVQIEKNKTQ